MYSHLNFAAKLHLKEFCIYAKSKSSTRYTDNRDPMSQDADGEDKELWAEE